MSNNSINRLCSELKNDGSLKRGMFGKEKIYTATKKRRNARTRNRKTPNNAKNHGRQEAKKNEKYPTRILLSCIRLHSP